MQKKCILLNSFLKFEKSIAIEDKQCNDRKESTIIIRLIVPEENKSWTKVSSRIVIKNFKVTPQGSVLSHTNLRLHLT